MLIQVGRTIINTEHVSFVERERGTVTVHFSNAQQRVFYGKQARAIWKWCRNACERHLLMELRTGEQKQE